MTDLRFFVKSAVAATMVMVALALCQATLQAQTTAASIQGTVTDDTGAVLPGVTININAVETGMTRTVVTDLEGRYFAPQLPLGEYEVHGQMAGFRAAVRRGILLTLNRDAIVDLKLAVGGVAEEVVVTGEAALIESTNAMVAGRVSERQMTELPINSRSYVDLALLQPGTIKVRNPGGGVGDEGTHLTVAGARPEETTFLLDGTVTTSVRGKAPSSAAGNALGVDSIREFVVITSPFNAEFGRASGGTVSVVTKSGTNRLRGSAFGFHRNEALEARNYFDPPDAEQPNFKRNQFGFALGGKVVANRTFFFGNYEGLRQSLGRTSIYRVPTGAGRQGVLGNRVVTVNPAVQTYLAFFPLPNSREFGDGTGEFLTQSNRVTDEDFYTGRLDHQFSGSQSIFGRYTLSNSSDVFPGALNHFQNTIASRSQYVTVEHKSVISSQMVNVARFGFTRNNLRETESDVAGVSRPDVVLQPGLLLPQINVSTLSSLGSAALPPRYMIDNVYELYNSLNYTRGRHQIKAGGQIQFIQHDTENNTRQAGRWGFPSLESFLGGSANSFVIAPRELSDPFREFRQNFLAFFVQDDIRLTDDVTINLGLRSEYASTVTEKSGKIAWMPEDILLNATVDDMRTGDPWYDNPGIALAPRMGVAWKPFGDDQTSVRAGAGLFYDHAWAWWLSGTGAYRTAPFYNVMEFNETLAFPAPMEFFINLLRQRQGREIPSGNYLDQFSTDPEKIQVWQYSADVQRQLGATTVVKVGYRGSRARNQARLADFNKALPIDVVDGMPIFSASPQLRNPGFGPMILAVTDGDAEYNALLLEVNKRFSGGLQFQAAYTFSKMIDDASSVRSSIGGNVGGGNATSYDFPEYDRGLSDFDMRHNFVANFNAELPFGANRRFPLSGVADTVLGGWQVSSIITLTSGRPETISMGTTVLTGRLASGRRPDLIPGGNDNPVLGGPDQYFDPTQFVPAPATRFGTVGRNTLIGPGLATVDLSVIKNFPLRAVSDDFRISFRADVFNLLNRANFSQPSTNVFDGQGRLNNAVGRITSTSTPARQGQLSLRVSW